MPKRGLRMFLTSMLLVCALALSFTVGALALDSGEEPILSAEAEASELSVEESAASTTDTVIVSPTDTENNKSVDNASSVLGDDVSAKAAGANVVLDGGGTGRIAITLGEINIATVTPGSTFEVPVYLATEGLQVWAIDFFVDFNSLALELLSDPTDNSAASGILLMVNNKAGNDNRYTCFIESMQKGSGITSSSFDEPLKLFTLHFRMPYSEDAVKAVQDAYTGSNNLIDGVISVGLDDLSALVSPVGVNIDQVAGTGGQTVTAKDTPELQPDPVKADAAHAHTYLDSEGNIDLDAAEDLEPTCTEDGGTIYRCDLCDAEVRHEEPNTAYHPETGHAWDYENPGEVLAKPEGALACLPYQAVVHCADCNTTETRTVYVDTVPSGSAAPSAHTFTEGSYHAADDTYIAYYECDVCHLRFLDTDHTTAADILSDKDILIGVLHVGAELVPEKQIAYDGSKDIAERWDKSGNIEHWYCPHCEVYFKFDPNASGFDDEDPSLRYGEGEEGRRAVYYDRMPGDVTGDGRVTTADITRILRYMANEDVPGTYTSSADLYIGLTSGLNVTGNKANGDVTGDGKVTTADITRILRYMANEDVPGTYTSSADLY